VHAASVPCHSKDFGADRKNYQILIEAMRIYQELSGSMKRGKGRDKEKAQEIPDVLRNP